MNTSKNDPLAVSAGKVDVLAVPAGTIGEWRGVVTVDGLPEFRTGRTYETADSALRGAEKLRSHGRKLAQENATALATVNGGAQ